MEYNIAGPLCFSGDVVKRNVVLPMVSYILVTLKSPDILQPSQMFLVVLILILNNRKDVKFMIKKDTSHCVQYSI